MNKCKVVDMNTEQEISNKNILLDFLNKKNIFAVVGVSRDKTKYGRIVFDDLRSAGYKVYPINPNYDNISNETCYAEIKDLPVKPDVVSLVVPPEVTYKILVECKKLKIDKVWLQPGSESIKSIEYCKENHIECLPDQCILLNLTSR